MNKELMKELATIQDELAKLKPAVEQVNSASESVSKVDEKIPQLLEQMGALKIKTKKLKGEVDETFSSVKIIGQEVSGKIDSLNNQIQDTLKIFDDDGQDLKNKLSQQFKNKISETKGLISEVELSLEKIDSEYQSKVKTLISEVKVKSKKIFSIYKELEKIKSARQEYVDFMGKAEGIFIKRLEELEVEKFDSLNDRFTLVTSEFGENTKNILGEFSNKIQNEISKSTTAILSVKSTAKDLQTKYELKIDTLIKEVSKKSSEIFFIYDELENIKTTRGEYAKSLESAEKQLDSTLKTFKKDFEEVMLNADFSTIAGKISKLSSRLGRLEKHAHKHSFAGTKI
jgi:chromosome segregation ATPase